MGDVIPPRSALLAVLAFVGALACQAVGTTTVILYNDQGNYGRAVTVARQVIATDPDDAEAHFQLGLALSHLDSVDLAYEHFARATELDPGDARRRELAENNIQHNFARYYSQGQEAFQRGSFAIAARAFRTATAADPRRAAGFYNLGVTYLRLADGAPGFLDEAAEALRSAARQSAMDDPLYPRSVSALVRTLVRMESWESAVQWGERYVAVKPDDGGMWLQLSQCHEQLGHDDAAIDCRARSRQLQP